MHALHARRGLACTLICSPVPYRSRHVSVRYNTSAYLLQQACMHEMRYGYSASRGKRKRCTMSGKSRQSRQWSSAPMGPPVPFFCPGALWLLPQARQRGREAGGSRWEADRKGKRDRERERHRERETEKERESSAARTGPTGCRNPLLALPLPRLWSTSEETPTHPRWWAGCTSMSTACPLPAVHAHATAHEDIVFRSASRAECGGWGG